MVGFSIDSNLLKSAQMSIIGFLLLKNQTFLQPLLEICKMYQPYIYGMPVLRCDGNEPSRAYYAELANILPQDTITLTLGCAKFRFLDQEWGNLPGTDLPRLLDMGQCNDAYSAVVVAKVIYRNPTPLIPCVCSSRPA